MLDVLSANTKTLFDRWTVQRFQAIGFLRIALNCPSKIKEMVPFEKDLWNLVNKLKFRKIKSNFQRQLNEDIREIKRSNKVLVFADKTSNIYKLDIDEYKKVNN